MMHTQLSYLKADADKYSTKELIRLANVRQVALPPKGFTRRTLIDLLALSVAGHLNQEPQSCQ
jgi:hypothetical protein